jgi:antitoxin component YwqK of YwqJK toxin-antitoxin module
MNRPCLHFEFNEAWMQDKDAGTGDSDAQLMKSTASTIGKVETYEDKYPGGKVKATWSAGIGDDGRYLLHGRDTWYHENGQKMYQVEYKLGVKMGTETCYRLDGSKQWQRLHKEDGTVVWTQWWENGGKKSESTWKNSRATGPATAWDREGQVLHEREF